FTGYADIKAVVDAINEGNIYRYLTKPWDPDELLTVLQQACATYEQIVARKENLAAMRDYASQSVALLQELRQHGGTLDPAGQARAEQLAQTGTSLLERVERLLAAEQAKPST